MWGWSPGGVPTRGYMRMSTPGSTAHKFGQFFSLSIMRHLVIPLAAAAAVLTWGKPIVTRDSKTAVVQFGNDTGTPQHLASGILYGVPDAKNQIPVSNCCHLANLYANAYYSRTSSPTSATTMNELAARRFLLRDAAGYGGCLSTRYATQAPTIGFEVPCLIATEPLRVCALELPQRAPVQCRLYLPHPRSLGSRWHAECLSAIPRRRRGLGQLGQLSGSCHSRHEGQPDD